MEDEMKFWDKTKARELLQENEIRDVVQLNMLLKEMAGSLIEEMLEGERDAHLGYDRGDLKNKETENSRNGYSSKRVRTNHGEMPLKIPRDRAGEFEPELVKKHDRDISDIEERIISMYAKGMTVRDIQSHIDSIYGARLSSGTISNITNRIVPLVEEWRCRPLQPMYSIAYIDGIRYKVRSDGTIKEKTVYGVMGVDLYGKKDILGLWIAESESAKYWMQVMTDLRNRGVKDILIVTSDDLSGIEDAIKAVYPEAMYQGCVVHVIRNALKYVNWKDRKEFAKDQKSIYTAPSEQAAFSALESLEEKWGEEYSLAVSVWRRNMDRISTMFLFTEEIRKLIYTTNPIEAFNRQLRKVTKNRSLFPDDSSVLKLLFLATRDILAKWENVKIKSWNKILAQLLVLFDERVQGFI
jgi:transposase-like protein